MEESMTDEQYLSSDYDPDESYDEWESVECGCCPCCGCTCHDDEWEDDDDIE